MKYEVIKNYGDRRFKRITGVPRVLFEILAEVLTSALVEKHKKGGIKPKLSIEIIIPF